MSQHHIIVSLFNATGFPRLFPDCLLTYTQHSTLVFITETWPQYHTYGKPRSASLHWFGTMGISLLVNPECPYPVTILPDEHPQYSLYHLSCIVGATLYHCLYLPPRLPPDEVNAILHHLLRTTPHTHNTIYCGDFNACMGTFTGDARYNRTGEVLEAWINDQDLFVWNNLLHFGHPTFHSQQGSSIIDYFLSTHPLQDASIQYEDRSLDSNHELIHLSFRCTPHNTHLPIFSRPHARRT